MFIDVIDFFTFVWKLALYITLLIVFYSRICSFTRSGCSLNGPTLKKGENTSKCWILQYAHKIQKHIDNT